MLLQCISSFLISFPPRTQGCACQDCIFMQLFFFFCTICLPPRTKTFCLWRCPEGASMLWRVWALAPLSCCCFPEITEAGGRGLLSLTCLSQDAFRSLTWPSEEMLCQVMGGWIKADSGTLACPMGQAAPLAEAVNGFPFRGTFSASGATVVVMDAGTQPPSHTQ